MRVVNILSITVAVHCDSNDFSFFLYCQLCICPRKNTYKFIALLLRGTYFEYDVNRIILCCNKMCGALLCIE